MPLAAEDVEPLCHVVHGSVAEAFDGAQVVAAERVELDAQLVLRRVRSVRLPTFDGAELRATMTGFHRRAVDDATWVGRVEGEPLSRVVLTVRHGVTVGAVFGLDATYLIEPLPDGGTVLKAVDAELYPECGGAVVAPNSAVGQLDAEAATDSSDRIDVMVMYTPQARDAAGGVAAIEATAQAAVDIANVAFADSNITPRFNLVYVGLANYNDSGDMRDTDLPWLWLDGNSGSVASLRGAYGADLVSLIVNSGSYCGVGYVMQSVSSSFAPYAFQVTKLSCAVGNLSWAHEHGHNMGMEHDPDWGASPSVASYPYSFGNFVSGSYRTVMSYDRSCTGSCPRVAHFSNPGVTHNGVPTGIANQRDNHRTANNVAFTVANFRQEVCSEDRVRSLPGQTIKDEIRVFEACQRLIAGASFVVDTGGDVTFIAGDEIILEDGFSVKSGGRFTAQMR